MAVQTKQDRYAIPPLRADARTPDVQDAARVALVRKRWSSQDGAASLYAREVEENLRMLAGRQWDIYSPLAGGFVDPTRYMSDSEKRWRQRPVVNWLLYWFLLTHARVTENPPILAWQPSTPDRADAQLAEAMDTIWKTLWRECEMSEKDLLAKAWVLVGGAAYFKSRVDFSRGPNVLMATQTGDPQEQRQGALDVQVLNPLEVRGAWGPARWHEKRWQIHRTYLTCDEVLDRYGVEVTPQTFAGSAGQASASMLEGILFGAGYFSATLNQDIGSIGSGPDSTASGIEGYVAVDEMWERPSGRFPASGDKATDSPGGRLLIVTGDTVLHDSERPHNCKGAGPIQVMPGAMVPGRPHPTSLMTHLVPLQKTYNRGWAQILEHRNLNANPKLLTDAGIDLDEVTNAPGEVVEGGMLGGVPRLSYLAPPAMSNDVWRTQDMLQRVMSLLGNLEGAQGETPSADPSGELVEQLRFNSDRFISVLAKSGVECYARLAQDWLAILPSIWTTEQYLAYTGEDSVARVLPVLPEIFDGSVNVFADPESMLPESRGARQQKAVQLYTMGAFGNPADPNEAPKARKLFLQYSRFPHLGRMARPGGVDRDTAEKAVNRLVQGEPASAISLFPWYDFPTFIDVAREFMSSPEYLGLDPQIQQQFALLWQMLQGAAVAKTLQMQEVALHVKSAATAQQTAAQGAAQSLLPPPAPTDGDTAPDVRGAAPSDRGPSKSPAGTLT